MAGIILRCARQSLHGLHCTNFSPCAAALPNFCALTGTGPLAASIGPLSDQCWAPGVLSGPSTTAHVQQFVTLSASARHDASREELDLVYRDAINEMWPLTRQQRRLAARVQAALEQALLHDAALRGTLVQVHGFTVQEVRMSPDNMKAFVLWRAFPQHEDTARVELNRRLTTLRSAAAQRLQLRRMPRLEMRHDSLTNQQARLEAVMDHIREERAAEAVKEDDGMHEDNQNIRQR